MAFAWISFAQTAGANPYHHLWIYQGDVLPDPLTKPPKISIISSKNGELLCSPNIAISIKVSVGDSTTATQQALEEIYYKADWLPNRTSIYNYDPKSEGIYERKRLYEFSESINLTEIPDGNRSIIFYAVAKGRYQTGIGPQGSGLNPISHAYYYVNFNITGACYLHFTKDTIPPTVSILSLGKETWGKAEAQLNFNIDETVSVMAYSLDGQDKVTVRGNTTLTGLPYGGHNVTVYATDKAGNTGVSECLYFTVGAPETFTIISVAVASGTLVAAAIVGLLYLVRVKKLKQAKGLNKNE